jgi:predicted nucleotidyltransferase
MNYSLTGKHEKFCLLVAAGSTYTDAYLEAYQKPAGYDRKGAAEEGSRSMAITDMVLRVQELRRPVIRKFRRKLEYGLQKALEQCDVAWNLAYAQGDAKTLLNAVEMQAKLAQLLTEHVDVTHRHGLLDDASTEVLLAMKAQFENQKLKLEKNRVSVVTVESVSVSCPTHRPLLLGAEGSHPDYLEARVRNGNFTRPHLIPGNLDSPC